MNALRIAMGLTIATLSASALVAGAQEGGPADNQQAPGAENALHEQHGWLSVIPRV